MHDAWRVYLEMALGLTEIPRKKAQQAAAEIVAKGGATAAQVQGLVGDALAAGLANRDALTKIVRFEVDRALGAVGLATADEVSELTGRIRDLERQLRTAQDRVTAIGSGTVADPAVSTANRAGTDDIPAPLPARDPAKKAVAKKAVAKKAVAKKASPAKSAPGDVASGRTAPAVTAKRANTAAPAKDPVGSRPARKTAGKVAGTTTSGAVPVKKAAPPARKTAGGSAGPQKRTPGAAPGFVAEAPETLL